MGIDVDYKGPAQFLEYLTAEQKRWRESVPQWSIESD
jgi:hypothetical protein